jgi:uncharacterized protein YjiK
MNFIYWMLIFQVVACQNAERSKAPTGITLVDGYHFPYQLRQPNEKHLMPKILEEISGLGISKDGSSLVAIQDEDGLLFYIDAKTGDITREQKFWKDGDYEGIEWIADRIYVVKSTGTIYEVSELDKEEPKVEKHKFFLDSKNDVEGLAYDPKSNQLLLACKAEAGREGAFRHQKGIYTLDLDTKKMSEKPAYFVNLDSVNTYLQKSPGIRKLEKLIEFFDPDEPFGFAPSGIAIHPHTGHLYITSSVGKMLLVLKPDGQILHIEKLDKDVHPQPEGLCFADDGTLYVSNEGKGGKGRILRFDMK